MALQKVFKLPPSDAAAPTKTTGKHSSVSLSEAKKNDGSYSAAARVALATIPASAAPVPHPLPVSHAVSIPLMAKHVLSSRTAANASLSNQGNRQIAANVATLGQYHPMLLMDNRNGSKRPFTQISSSASQQAQAPSSIATRLKRARHIDENDEPSSTASAPRMKSKHPSVRGPVCKSPSKRSPQAHSASQKNPYMLLNSSSSSSSSSSSHAYLPTTSSSSSSSAAANSTVRSPVVMPVAAPLHISQIQGQIALLRARILQIVNPRINYAAFDQGQNLTENDLNRVINELTPSQFARITNGYHDLQEVRLNNVQISYLPRVKIPNIGRSVVFVLKGYAMNPHTRKPVCKKIYSTIIHGTDMISLERLFDRLSLEGINQVQMFTLGGYGEEGSEIREKAERIVNSYQASDARFKIIVKDYIDPFHISDEHSIQHEEAFNLFSPEFSVAISRRGRIMVSQSTREVYDEEVIESLQMLITGDDAENVSLCNLLNDPDYLEFKNTFMKYLYNIFTEDGGQRIQQMLNEENRNRFLRNVAAVLDTLRTAPVNASKTSAA